MTKGSDGPSSAAPLFYEDVMRRGRVTRAEALSCASAGHPRLRCAPAAGPRPDASQTSPASEGTPSSPLATSDIHPRQYCYGGRVGLWTFVLAADAWLRYREGPRR